MKSYIAALVSMASIAGLDAATPSPGKPNIIFILADDLGYGEVGCYGQKTIKTPNLDRMAAEGMRFTDFYSGSTVCAPARCVLMTGLHTGHAVVRDNARVPLRVDEITVAGVLQRAGYKTAIIGKWALGDIGNPGHPYKQGFDYFYGYLDQGHAHNYYPEFLYRGETRVSLRNEVVSQPGASPGRGVAVKRVDYTHDLLVEDALKWIEFQRKGPSFLYLALTLPHADNEARRATGDGTEVRELGEYAARDWTKQNKGQAAMIDRLDRDVGRVLDHLKKLQVDRNTLVIFSSDNGPHNESGHDLDLFDGNGPFRGRKRELYEGGIRVPTLAWWPGAIEPGVVSRHVGFFADLLPTAAEVAGIETPAGRDGISFLPTLLGRSAAQRQHDYLYWEFHMNGFSQAVRMGKWKAVRIKSQHAPIELYNLSVDLAEANNVAADHPAVAARAAEIFRDGRTDSEYWPIKNAVIGSQTK